MNHVSRRIGWLVKGCIVLAAACGVALSAWALAGTGAANDATYQRIYARAIPAAGTETAYGIPLSLANLPQFIAWRDTIVLNTAQAQTFHDALVGIPAPCCDDETAFQCCCEKSGQRCNIVTSAKGLAAYLIQTKNYSSEEPQAAVVQWLTFARPDYYMAKALGAEGIDPSVYNLTAQGSCYRGLCETPISQGGCGGMGKLIEPAIEGSKI